MNTLVSITVLRGSYGCRSDRDDYVIERLFRGDDFQNAPTKRSRQKTKTRRDWKSWAYPPNGHLVVYETVIKSAHGFWRSPQATVQQVLLSQPIYGIRTRDKIYIAMGDSS